MTVDQDGAHAHPIVLDYSRDLTWEQETIELSTVGIDIGSATTHVTFARVYLQRIGQLMTDRYRVVRRDVIWQSPVALTPYLDLNEIDAASVRSGVEGAYALAGVGPDDVDTGAVLLTGVALLRENAEPLTRELASFAGDFVCAAASHEMEAVLAANGSGALDLSRAREGVILSLDVGGGTAKYTWLHRGDVIATAAVGVGGRLVAWDEERVVDRLERYASDFAKPTGVDVRLGQVLEPADEAQLCRAMAAAVVDGVHGRPDRGQGLAVLTPWPEQGEIGEPEHVVLSGGVAEYLHGTGTAGANDLGATLASSLSRELDERQVSWAVAPKAIRATVLGAAGFSVDVSGNTVYSSATDLLPIRDVPVVVASIHSTDEPDLIRSALTAAIDGYHGVAGRPLCLYLDLDGRWTAYRDVRVLADAIAEVWNGRLSGFDSPLALVMQPDLAGSLGRILDMESGLESDVVALDGITLATFDFIDIGAERRGVHPVVIKSLIFGDEAASLPV